MSPRMDLLCMGQGQRSGRAEQAEGCKGQVYGNRERGPSRIRPEKEAPVQFTLHSQYSAGKNLSRFLFSRMIVTQLHCQ